MYPTTSNCSPEVAQRLAFSFGYSWWRTSTKQVETVSDKNYLVFNADEKWITSLHLNDEPKNSVIVETADELIGALSNPQLDAVVITSKDNTVTAKIDEEGIMFERKGTGSYAFVPKELFDRISNAVNGDRKGLPVVCFAYPNSSGHDQTHRYVAVTRMDSKEAMSVTLFNPKISRNTSAAKSPAPEQFPFVSFISPKAKRSLPCVTPAQQWAGLFLYGLN